MPTASELLVAWEHAAGLPPARRDLALLRARGESGDLTPGRRNAALLRARGELFGPRLELVTGCPACGEPLELSVPVAELQPADEERATGILPAVRLKGGEVMLRLPTLGDLAELPSGLAPSEARRWLAERCLVSSSSSSFSPSPLTDAAIDTLSAALSAADPAGVLEFALNCPACGHAWSAPLDAGAVLEADLAAWVRATLAEVHTLAAAYGWTEAEVLALSPARRRVYLELLGAV